MTFSKPGQCSRCIWKIANTSSLSSVDVDRIAMNVFSTSENTLLACAVVTGRVVSICKSFEMLGNRLPQ